MNLDIKICFCNFAVMKTPLKELIAQSKTILDNECDKKELIRLNDQYFVFHSALLAGSKLNRKDSNFLMGRNTIPLKWSMNPKRQDFAINLGLKNALIKIKYYIDNNYDITPGRLVKLQEILMEDQYYRQYVDMYKDHYLDELNDRRDYALEEMTDLEIYDFSFDVMYELSEKFSCYKGGGRLARLIMYWIQRENRLIPIAVGCDKQSYEQVLNVIQDGRDKEEGKREFRMFMRNLMVSHLKKFIRIADGDKAEVHTSRDRILTLVKDNPKHTARTMAVKLGMSIQGVQKQIAILKAEKRLVRVGSDRSGSWEAC